MRSDQVEPCLSGLRSMIFITIIFVALLNLIKGYALGLAWLRVTAIHKTPAESTAYEIVSDSNRDTAESSCHAPGR